MELSNNPNRDIKNAIEFLSGQTGLKKARFVTANVDDNSKGTSDRTIDVSIVLGDSGKITGVNLQSEPNDGFILIPKEQTQVIVCIMPDNSAYVFKCNDIDKIICVIDSSNSYVFDTNGFIWNGGNNGGLIKVIELTQKLNNLENKINNLITIFNSWTPVANDGGAALKTVLTAWVSSSLTTTVRTDIENTKIKH